MKGYGVWDSTLKRTAPQWQEPSSSIGPPWRPLSLGCFAVTILEGLPRITGTWGLRRHRYQRVLAAVTGLALEPALHGGLVERTDALTAVELEVGIAAGGI